MLRYLKIFSLFIVVFFTCCNQQVEFEKTSININSDTIYTQNKDSIKVGSQIKIGFTAQSKEAYFSNIRIKKIIGETSSVQLDAGIWIEENIDTSFVFTKSSAAEEQWEIFVMNSNRDSVKLNIYVYLAAGSGYSEINYYPSILLSYPGNTEYGNFLDFETGTTYKSEDVNGNEASVDMITFFYYTSGKPSPTISCPGYSSVPTYYPEVLNWSTKNSTSYDYRSTDNNLISIEQFDNAQNDSLLINAFLPGYVSGLDKFCYSGKVIPFKNCNGKYGLIKVVRADETENGTMEIAVKIQK